MTRARGILLALALAAAVGCDGLQRPESRAMERPNVLLIVTDDQRKDGTLQAMPTTRRLFERHGVVYENAVATTPTCCPSRASLFTGRYAHNHGVLTSEDGQFRHLDHDATIQRYLSDAGYTTAIFGKFLNDWALRTPPHFDRYALPKHEDVRMFRGGRWNVNGKIRTVARYTTDFIADMGADFISEAESTDTRPWFLVLTVPAPHKPYLPAPRHRDASVEPLEITPAMTEEDRGDKPPYVSKKRVTLEWIRDVRSDQLRSLMSVDDLVARMFENLRDNEEENTLAFFLSDNGYLWGEHGVNGKRYPYMPSVKVPLLARWPGRIEPRRSEALVGIIDIAPTVLEAARVTPEQELDGWSLLGDHRREHILLEYWSRSRRPDADWASLLTTSYQYIETYGSRRSAPAFYEYYDLERDPYQLENRYVSGDGSRLPDRSELSATLAADSRCAGTSGAHACP